MGGATFQVPTEIRSDRKESISMKNLILYARKRGGKTMADKLGAEIVDAFNGQGGSFKSKEDMQMKLDVFFAGNRITSAEYEELTQLLIAK